MKSVSPALNATHFMATDGKVMPYSTWPADPQAFAQPRSVLICVHGLSGAASDFWPAAEKFECEGMVVYGMQLRGMGNDPDPRQRGNIANNALWISDLLAFTQAVHQLHPSLPIYWYGESLGALIVTHAVASLPEHSLLVAGIILSSPVIAFRHELPRWKYWLIRTVVAIAPGKCISLESLGDQEVKVTVHTTHKQQMQRTPHYVEFFTLRLFRTVDKLVRTSPEAARKLRAPLLLMYTPNDVFTSQQQIEQFYELVPSPDKSKVFFPQSFHLILHDVEREGALVELAKWFRSHQALVVHRRHE